MSLANPEGPVRLSVGPELKCWFFQDGLGYAENKPLLSASEYQQRLTSLSCYTSTASQRKLHSPRQAGGILPTSNTTTLDQGGKELAEELPRG